MRVSELLEARRSIRAFLPKSIEEETLIAILEAAGKSPSWTNVQPWEVYVAQGETLDRIKRAYRENYAQNLPDTSETPRPTQWSVCAKARQNAFFAAIKNEGGTVADSFVPLNKELFHAPAVVYLCVDRVMSEWSLYDIGLYSQSLMLLATEYGLGSIAAVTLAAYPEVLRRELGVPENLKFTLGIALGYADGEHPINDFRSDRVPLGETVRFF